MNSDTNKSVFLINSVAKVANGLFAKDAVIAADEQNIYILDKESTKIEFTLPINKIKKAYAQLGELYINYGFGKMIVVKFVTVDSSNVLSAFVSSTLSDANHIRQASSVQADVQHWLDFFGTKNIKAKQQLSPKKALIILGIGTAFLIVVRFIQSL